MLIHKLLHSAGILRNPAGEGQDLSRFEEEFDESVLDKDDIGDKDGSNFQGSDDPHDIPDDPDKELAAERAAAAKRKAAAAPEKKEEPKNPEPKKDGPVEGEKKPEAKEGEGEEDDVDADKPKSKSIPLDRHEAILKKMRDQRDEAVRAVANAQGGAQVVKTNNEITALEAKVDELQGKYDAALIDGDKELAKTVAKDLRVQERALGDKKTAIAVAIARAEAIETTRFDIARERIEEKYPVLNSDSPEFDQAVMDEILELTEAYQLKGYTATDAMQKAVRKELGAKTVAQQEVTEVKPRVNEPADKEDKDVGTRRKENAVDKAMKTVQPPVTEALGANHDKMGKTKSPRDVMKMTEKEFDALSDEELADLGGDRRLVEESEDRV